jgi:zinc protease
MIISAKARRLIAACVVSLSALAVAVPVGVAPTQAVAQAAAPAGSPGFQLMPLPGFAHERYREIPVDPAITYGTLPNGVRYAVRRNARPEGEVAIRVRFAAGSFVEQDNQAGLMHFLEHMAFNGSENVGENEFDQLLSREGLAFGADTNASTGFLDTNYRLDMPKADKLPLGLMLMRETASRLLLDQGAIDRERGIIVSEERSRATPGFKQLIATLNHLAPGMLLNRRLPIGDMDVVRNAPRDRFVELYRGYYTPERTFIVVVGDVDPAVAVAEIEKAFGDWTIAPGTALPDPDLGRHIPNDGAITTYVDPQLTTSISLSVTHPFTNEEDTLENRRISFARSLAASVINTRFARLARQENSPILGAGVSYSDFVNSFEVASLDISPKDDSAWQAALALGELELRKALTHGITEEELRVVIASTRSALTTAVTQAESRRSAGLAGAILGGFAGDGVVTTPETNLAIFERIAPTITADFATSELRKLWVGREPSVMLTTTAPVAGGEATVQRAYTAARAQAVPQPEQLVTRPWNITQFGPSMPAYSRTEVSDLGVTQVRFANNVRLVVKQTDFEPGRVRVALNFGEGSSQLYDAPKGTDMAIESMFVSGGLQSYEIDELGRALAGRSVGLGFGVSDDSYGLAATTTRADLLLQLQLFGAYLTQPGFRPDGFNQMKAARDAMFRGLRATPGDAYGNFGGPLLVSNDQRWARITEQEFDSLQMADAQARLEPQLRDGPIEIVIVGDIPVSEAIATVQRSLAQLPTRRAAPNPDPRALRAVFTASRGEDVIEHEGRADQSLAMIYWPMGGYGDGAEARAVRLLTEVLQVRLNEVIREEEGGTYSPSSIWNPSTFYPGYGYIGASMEVEPKDAARLLARVEAVAADLAAGNISEDLFNRARNPMIADFEETRRNNPFWMNWLSGSSWEPRNLEIIRGGQRHYEQVTLEQLKGLARTYLDPSKARIIRVVPGPNAQPVEAEAPTAAREGQ